MVALLLGKIGVVRQSAYPPQEVAAVSSADPPPSFQDSKGVVEPAFWWTLPPCYYKELCHCYYGRRVIDLSPGCGNFCISTWEQTPPTPYAGVCFNSDHMGFLLDHLVGEYLARMATEGHALFNKDYAEFKRSQGPSSTPRPEVVAVSKPKAKAKGKAKAAPAPAAVPEASPHDDEAAAAGEDPTSLAALLSNLA